jgi:small-conductance mechanosensitive channel
MFHRYIDFEKFINETEILFPLIVLSISILAGIALVQLLFSKFRNITKKVSGDFYPLIQRAMNGMPMLWGILLGGYATIHIITLPPAGLHVLDILFQAIVVLSLTIMGARLASAFISMQLQKNAGDFASTSILINTIELIIYTTGFLIMLDSFGISIAPLLTALGVGGLAVALALKDTLSNLFSGISILLAKQTKVGDYVKLSTGEEGYVSDMNWRSTTIRQLSNNMVVIPNEKIASAIITNYTLPETECSLVVPIGVSYDSDLDHVEKVTIEVAKSVLSSTEGAVAEFEPFIRYNAFGDSSIKFSVILRVKTIVDQYVILHEFIKQLHLRYRQEGIQIPFPVRTIKIQNEGGAQ